MLMKKLFTLIVTALLVASAQAQTFSGYYRIWNDFSKRYLSLLDNKGWAKASTGGLDYDLFAIRTLLDNEANDIVSNPAAVIFISGQKNAYNCAAQGTSLQKITAKTFQIRSYYQNGKPVAGKYLIRAEEGSLGAVVLHDMNYFVNFEAQADSGNVGAQNPSGLIKEKTLWHFDAISSNSSCFFGFTPSLHANGKYYQTFYAGFPFKVVSPGVAVYYVCAIADGKTVLKPFAAGVTIPAETPVLVECTSPSAANNKVELLVSTAAAPKDNLLRGVFFNYTYDDYTTLKPSSSNRVHNNRTAYSPSTMRLLRVNSAGELIFDKVSAGEEDYRPYIAANTAYLTVPSSAPDELPMMTYTDYTAGIDGPTTTAAPADDAVYTLSGVRVTDTGYLPHGIYIKGGKKVVR